MAVQAILLQSADCFPTSVSVSVPGMRQVTSSLPVCLAMQEFSSKDYRLVSSRSK